MREDKAPQHRPPRLLPTYARPEIDNLELAGIEITVDGQTMSLGDYWGFVRVQAQMVRAIRAGLVSA